MDWSRVIRTSGVSPEASFSGHVVRGRRSKSSVWLAEMANERKVSRNTFAQRKE